MVHFAFADETDNPIEPEPRAFNEVLVSCAFHERKGEAHYGKIVGYNNGLASVLWDGHQDPVGETPDNYTVL